ncbi:MAG: hypothetical protein V4654_05885 [Bdellovibrionota bacterium]
MKRMSLSLLVFLFAVSSEAQIKKTYQRVKQAVTGSAKISQLHYFPSQWEVDLALGFRYSSLSLNGKSTGLTVLEADQSISILTTSLTLGVLDNVYAQLKWDYMINFNLEYSKPDTQPSSKSKGSENPAIAGVVRVVDGGSVKLDGKIEISPSTGDHLEADATHDGDAKSGGHTTTIGGRFVVLVTGSSQLGFGLDYTVFSLERSRDQSSGQISESAKHNQTTIEISTLTEITSDLFFGLMLDIVNVDSYKSTDLTSLSTTDYGSTSGKTINLIGKYEVTPDSSISAEVGYIIDYSTNIGSLDVSASGYSMATNYLVRF